MIFNLLTSAEDSAASNGGGWGSLVMMGVLLLIVVAFSIFNSRSQKKRQAEAQKQLDAIRPGTKVKTIGGICGVVVSVGDDNTFVLETGDGNNKSYIQFDKQAVYQSDALENKEETSEKAEEETAENKTEENKDAE